MAELIWKGKYDADGRKRVPVRVALPFQTDETVNESVQQRQRTLELAGPAGGSEWRNRLIWGVVPRSASMTGSPNRHLMFLVRPTFAPISADRMKAVF